MISILKACRPHLVIAGFWLLLALLFMTQLGFSGRVSWEDAARSSAAEWLPWMLLSPLLFWLAGRFPLERGKWLIGLLVNVPVAVASMGLAEILFQAVAGRGPRNPMALPPRPGLGPGRESEDGFGPPRKRPGPPGPRRRFEKGEPEAGIMLRPPPFGPVGPRSGPMQHLMHFHVPICLFTLMAAHAYSYFRRYQEKEHRAMELTANLAEARLLALQMQLQPHFLFNALNAMSTLVHRNPQAADDMITNLSELLRRALTAGTQSEITLARELDYVRCYLEIERVRFGNRLEVRWEIDPATATARVPVLCLQAIVENAVRHGIERRTTDIGRIEIATARKAEQLLVTVADNGPGIVTTDAQPRGHGVGLGNTRARLATLYGDAASIELANLPPGGCQVTLVLPFNPEPSSSA